MHLSVSAPSMTVNFIPFSLILRAIEKNLANMHVHVYTFYKCQINMLNLSTIHNYLHWISERSQQTLFNLEHLHVDTSEKLRGWRREHIYSKTF